MSTNFKFSQAAHPDKSIPVSGTATGEVLGVKTDSIMAIAAGFAGERIDPVDIAAKLHLAKMTLVTAGGGIAHNSSIDTSGFDAVKVHKPIDNDGEMFRKHEATGPAGP